MLEGSLAAGLKAAVSAARMPWLMFLRPGTLLDTPWTSEVTRFLQQDPQQACAAVFQRGGRQTALREVLIAKHLYNTVGGHSERAGDPEHDLLRRVGRRRIVKLATQAFGGR